MALSREEAREILKSHQASRRGEDVTPPEKYFGFAASGVPIAAASTADIPAFVGNLGLSAANKVGLNPNNRQIPYYANEAATNLVNQTFGEPQTQGEQEARNTGELLGSFINPTAPIKGARNLGQLIKNAPGKAANAAIGFQPEKYELFKNSGISPSLTEVSSNRPFKALGNLNAEIPGGAGEAQKFFANRSRETENALSQNLNLNQAKIPQEAGQLYREGAKAYNSKASEVASKLYARAWKGVPDDFTVNLSGTSKKIDEVLQTFSEGAKEILESSGTGKALIELRDNINKTGELPFKDVKNVYKAKINNLIKSFDQVGPEDQGKLKLITKALDNESMSALEKKYPQNYKDLKKANKFWQEYSDHPRDVANKAANQSNSITNFDAALNGLKRGKAEDFAIITKRLPKEKQQEVTASAMTKLGQRDGEFDPRVWAKEYTKLPKESKRALSVGLDAQQYHKINEIASAIQDTKGTAALSNNSRTAYTAILATLVSQLFSGNAAALGTAGIVAGSKVAGKALYNQKLIDGLYAVSKVKSDRQFNKVLAKYGPTFGRFGVTTGEHAKQNSLSAQEARELLKNHQQNR